ncbi:hypothetical protein [Bradyrhizobium sp. AUGA SZCCT0160]|uniref:hypothetical protein n=1 Tax=Bradyrhizobium sp. AUGA SZCCT0160 TaxID=2807662 RepID=UPI001BA944A5|nr:hypothetical protein [Bradyrhizobium sp. AUGA SZCCT0160]MBR1192684.1 hypothetical protein [Bradyrhizobium sp. AUGA SZCCT0160]
MRRFLLATAMLAYAILPAAALLANEPPDTLVRDALDAPYGRAMLARFAAAVEKTAEAACRRERGLNSPALAAGVRDVLVRYGVRLATLVNGSHDEGAAAKAFAANMGPDAAAELARLERDPEVARFEELARPRRLASVVTQTFEQFDHYIAMASLKLENVTPVARGEQEPMPEDPTVATEEAVEKFIAQSSSHALQRYLELADQVEAARTRSVNSENVRKLEPMELFANADRDLAALCIGKK